ncbi:MAG: hypothetical protein HQK77_20520 [Desulfobacterales bacterium]|nr:hypothetical protein [Desulfobacterales bacterium]
MMNYYEEIKYQIKSKQKCQREICIAPIDSQKKDQLIIFLILEGELNQQPVFIRRMTDLQSLGK